MIQIDMTMPKCCDECFALDDYGDYPFCLISQDQRGYTFNTKEKRMPTCPLKAQEQKPISASIVDSDGGLMHWWACGNCQAPINPEDKFCHECGRPVKRE
jgi:hypothetical protein